MTMITIENTVKAPVDTVWKFYTEPTHIKKWNAASDDWHTPHAESDLRAGGKFLSRMEAKDGSFGFDFTGVFTEVKTNELIAYTMEDERTVKVSFSEADGGTKITIVFEAESQNPVEMQQSGWQSILDNFKKYTEAYNDDK